MDASHFDTAAAKPIGNRLPDAGHAELGDASTISLGVKWSALHDVAATVCTIASLPVDGMTAKVRNVPLAIRDAGGRQRQRAEHAIADLSAVMEPGVAALLCAYARGADPRAAAAALVEEFRDARDAIMALASASEETRTTRIA